MAALLANISTTQTILTITIIWQHIQKEEKARMKTKNLKL